MPTRKAQERQLSFDPLRRIMEQPGSTTSSGQNLDGLMTYESLAAICGVGSRTIGRYARAGRLPMSDADRIACRLGLHPILLWPDFQTEPFHPRELVESAQLFDPDADT